VTDKGDPKHEFDILCERLLHYSKARTTQIVAFLVITGALVAAPFRSPDIPIAAIALFGIVMTLAFYLLDVRVTRRYDYHVERAEKLEKELGYRVFTGLPRGTLVRVRTSARIIFSAAFLFWLGLAVSRLLQFGK
jgi:hypothetical protein